MKENQKYLSRWTVNYNLGIAVRTGTNYCMITANAPGGLWFQDQELRILEVGVYQINIQVTTVGITGTWVPINWRIDGTINYGGNAISFPYSTDASTPNIFLSADNPKLCFADGFVITSFGTSNLTVMSDPAILGISAMSAYWYMKFQQAQSDKAKTGTLDFLPGNKGKC